MTGGHFATPWEDLPKVETLWRPSEGPEPLAGTVYTPSTMLRLHVSRAESKTPTCATATSKRGGTENDPGIERVPRSCRAIFWDIVLWIAA